MKKLLSIFSSFGVTMSSSLTIISCSSSDEQKAINKAVEQLKNKTINVTVTDGNKSKVEKGIKDNDDFKSKIADSNIKIESFKFTQNNKEFSGNFKNNESYEVTLKLKKENGTKKQKVKLNLKLKLFF